MLFHQLHQDKTIVASFANGWSGQENSTNSSTASGQKEKKKPSPPPPRPRVVKKASDSRKCYGNDVGSFWRLWWCMWRRLLKDKDIMRFSVDIIINVARLGLVSWIVFVAFFFDFGGLSKAKVIVVVELNGSWFRWVGSWWSFYAHCFLG